MVDCLEVVGPSACQGKSQENIVQHPRVVPFISDTFILFQAPPVLAGALFGFGTLVIWAKSVVGF